MEKVIANITPNFAFKFSQKSSSYFASLFYLTLVFAIYFINNSPIDYQQGNAVKIMYIHVPSAWLSLLIYSSIAILSIFSFIYQNPLFTTCSIALAPIGACFALITLVTGSIWGKPMWGTWWVFDARLTSTLVLFLLYLGYISLYMAYDSLIMGSKIAAILAIIGFINVPIVKFSVDIWNSLHQPASILRKEGIAIDPSMLKPLLITFLALIFYSLHLFTTRLNTLLLKRKISRNLQRR